MDPFSQSIILFEKVSMTMLGIEPKGFSQIDSTPHFPPPSSETTHEMHLHEMHCVLRGNLR